MSNALTKQESALLSLAMNEQELIRVLESSLYPGASHESIKLVIGYCTAAGLDPIQKPVHIVPIWDSRAGRLRDVVMPGIGMYRTQAARGGQYAGVTEPEFGPDVHDSIGGQNITYPSWCKVTVKRLLPNGQTAEFTATERWMENYAQKGGKDKSIAPNAMWTRRPYAQLAKCAEAQALRKAFPEFGAQPTADEMEGKEINQDVIDVPVTRAAEPKALPDCPPETFAKNLTKVAPDVQAGTKTIADVLAGFRKRYTLTEAQVEAIEDLVEMPSPVDLEFVAAMESAEGEQ